ncbi:MAG: hypothetical protein ACRENQ_05820 [Gemmatimonadaceae bacterium]
MNATSHALPFAGYSVQKMPAHWLLARLGKRVLPPGGVETTKWLIDADAVPMDDGSASLAFGEAMLSMQSDTKKQNIMSEARRILRPGGRYAIHELCLSPENIDPSLRQEIKRDLSEHIRVGVHIGTTAMWQEWLGARGFDVENMTTRPMRLLELDRLIDDEGIRGVIRIVVNAARTRGAITRLPSVRRTFRRHAAQLSAIAIVARARA